MSKRASVFALLVLLVACAKATAPSGAGGIQGRVTIGPSCPVEVQGSPCPDAPFAAMITVSMDGSVVTTFTTGEDGKFRIPLGPGTYEITAEPAESGGIATLRPIPPVGVADHGYTSVTITFDSGLR